MWVRATLWVILLCLLGSCSTRTERQGIDLSPSALIRINHLLAAEVNSGRTPSISVAIGLNGRLVYVGGFGLADIRHRRFADRSTLYDIGSVSKQFTAATILHLVQGRKLRLDDRLSTFVPEYRFSREITIEELLYQTSGLPDFEWLLSRGFGKVKTWAQLLTLVNAQPMEAVPGRFYNYNNLNYIMLALVVQRCTGKTFSDYLRNNMLAPQGLGTIEETADARALKKAGKMASGYTSDKRGSFQNATLPPELPLLGAGTIASSASDLVRWDGRLFGDVWFGRELLSRMTTPPPVSDDHYGMGLMVQDRVPEQRFFWHNGEVSGFRAMNAYFPDIRLAIVVLANIDAFNASDVTSPKDSALEILGIVAPSHAYAVKTAF